MTVAGEGEAAMDKLRAEIQQIDRDMKYRTVCANGNVHAEFSVAHFDNLTRRCQRVADYDDRLGCGPHTVQFGADGDWITYEGQG